MPVLIMIVSKAMLRVALYPLVTMLFFGSASAQVPKRLFNSVSGETYDSRDFAVKTKPIAERLCVYHFGESEGEWDLVLLSHGGSLAIQAWSGEWTRHKFTGVEWWQMTCKTFNKVTLQGNKLIFGNYTAQFGDYKEKGGTTNALFLFDDIFSNKHFANNGADVGHYTTSFEKYYAGKDYGRLSVSVVPDSYFKGKTKQELKIMRNTIYARYGLAFSPGGEMETYFRKKDWYNPFLADVSACLTEIEKKNIETIVRLERER